MTTRMTAQRLGRLIEAGDVDAVRTAVAESPHLLGHTVCVWLCQQRGHPPLSFDCLVA